MKYANTLPLNLPVLQRGYQKAPGDFSPLIHNFASEQFRTGCKSLDCAEDRLFLKSEDKKTTSQFHRKGKH